MSSAIAAEVSIAATRQSANNPRVLPRPCDACPVPWTKTTTQATAKVPNMNTSECAKLISWRTPYTIVYPRATSP